MDVPVKLRKRFSPESEKMLNGQPVGIFAKFGYEQRNKMIKQIKGVTQRYITRVTGIHQSFYF